MTIESESSRTLKVGELNIHYHDLGSGERTVILLHGGGPGAAGWSNYSRNAEALAKHFRVLVIDLPGFGKSTRKAATGSIFEFLSDAVIGAMDALSISKASLVGNSLGGGTSLKLCLRWPDRVERLVLMGTAGSTPIFSPVTPGAKALFKYYKDGGPTIEKLREVIRNLVNDSSAISDELLQERFEASRHPDTLANPPLKGLGTHVADDLWRDRLDKLTHKVLLVWGREDQTVPLDAAFILLKSLRNAQLHVYPRCGHWAQWEKADEFNALVTDFLLRDN